MSSNDQDILDFVDEVTNPKASSRKNPPSSRRNRREQKNDDLDLDQFTGTQSSNFDSITVVSASTSMSGGRPQPQPRRSTKAPNDYGGGDDDIGANEISAGKGVVAKPAASKAINSWGDDKPSSSRHRSPKFGSAAADLGESIEKESLSSSVRESTNMKKNRREIDDTEELDIPEIPDLEETIEPNDNLAFKIAEAPDIQVHQISTYKELDKEFFREKAFQFLEGNIDVSLLHCGLSTEQQIAEEEDVVWDWTKLFTEVVSVLTMNKKSSDDDFLTAAAAATTTGNQSLKATTTPNAVAAAAAAAAKEAENDPFEILRSSKPGRSTTQNRREIDF